MFPIHCVEHNRRHGIQCAEEGSTRRHGDLVEDTTEQIQDRRRAHLIHRHGLQVDPVLTGCFRLLTLLTHGGFRRIIHVAPVAVPRLGGKELRHGCHSVYRPCCVLFVEGLGILHTSLRTKWPRLR